MGISNIEKLIDTDSPQYRAACWIIHDDLFRVKASDQSLVQHYVLALLYYSTHGWDWTNKDLFLVPISECYWGRYWWLECDYGYVIQIDLTWTNLQGTIVSELSKIRSLGEIISNCNTFYLVLQITKAILIILKFCPCRISCP